MKEALVIHPVMSYYAGGEYLCLVVCETLQSLGYRVNLATQTFSVSEVERIYGMGGVLQKCNWIQVPAFKSSLQRLASLQVLSFSSRVWKMLRDVHADVVFSTQTSSFVVNGRMFHFVYNANDLFGYPKYAAPILSPYSGSGLRKIYFDLIRFMKKRLWKKAGIKSNWFFAVGTRVLEDLRSKGYSNASLAFPPCRLAMSPRTPKRKTVIQSARIVPDKRLEVYFEIASKLPEYDFVLVGRRDKLMEEAHPGYSDRLLDQLPKNVSYVDGTVLEHSDLIESSQVYMYTGNERGIVLGLVEGMAAGCIPFAPAGTGAVDIIKASGLGVVYQGVDDAVAKLRASLASDFEQARVKAISTCARRFGPEIFGKWIESLTSLDAKSPVADFWPQQSPTLQKDGETPV